MSREQKARELYNHALTIRKGKGDRGLNASMEIFRDIIRDYPETSAARDAQAELRTSEDLKRSLDDIRRDFRRKLERLKGRTAPSFKCSGCGHITTSPSDRCPNCGIEKAGVKCTTCGYVDTAAAFRANNGCPQCKSAIKEAQLDVRWYANPVIIAAIIAAIAAIVAALIAKI